MPPEKVQILLSVVGLGINLFGFIFVIRQIRQQALATRGETYTSLCGLSYEILQMIAAKPYLYAFFYERRVLDKEYEHRVDVLMCCEMIANYIDNAFTQKGKHARCCVCQVGCFRARTNKFKHRPPRIFRGLSKLV